MWYHRDSNLGHTDFQSVALPTELWYRLSERKHTQQFDFAPVLNASFWMPMGRFTTGRKRQDHAATHLSRSNYMWIWSTRRLDSRKINDWPLSGFIQRKSPRILNGDTALCNTQKSGHTLHRELAYKSLVLHLIPLLFYLAFLCLQGAQGMLN